MYYITYNGVITPHAYLTREEAILELKQTFPDIELDSYNVAYWPNISARGNTKIEILKYEGEVE